MTKVAFRDLNVGDTFGTNEGGSVTVVKIINHRNILVKHNDHYGHTTTCQLVQLNNGDIKNPYHPSLENIGYLGVGPYVRSINRSHTLCYVVWKNMINRCYNKSNWIKQPAYVDVTVDVEWHNFQNFAHWYCNHPDYNKGYQLDKDILYPGNRIYSQHTCVMVPSVINNLFSDNNLSISVRLKGGAYESRFGTLYLGRHSTKEKAVNIYLNAKRAYILEVSTQWNNHIDVRVYRRLLQLADTLAVPFD